MTKFSPSSPSYKSRNNLVHIVIEEKIIGPKPFLTESSSRSKLSNILAKPPQEGRASIVQEVGSDLESEENKHLTDIDSSEVIQSYEFT